jgi:hypothetical protein
MVVMLIDNISEVYGINDLYIIGSKAEKMSGSMQGLGSLHWEL